MKKIFFTPGPSQIFPTIPKHLKEALRKDILSLSHRSSRFKKIFYKTVDDLRQLLNIPKSHHIFFLSSGTEVMERVIENCVEKHSFHFVNGGFSQRFFETAIELKKVPFRHQVALGDGFDFDKVEINKKTELICVTQNETSTGVALDKKDIVLLKKNHPDKLLAVDIVSSAPYVNIDYSFADLVFFSVQKGFGLPAGLAVLIVSPEAIEKSKYLINKGVNVGSYHNFINLLKYADKGQTPETPNVLAIYLLGQVIKDMFKLGIRNIRKAIEKKVNILYNFFEESNLYRPFIKQSRFRSKTVIVVEVKNGSSNIIKKLTNKGYIVGNGYQKFKDKQIRIANFPAHSLASVKQLLVYFKKYERQKNL